MNLFFMVILPTSFIILFAIYYWNKTDRDIKRRELEYLANKYDEEIFNYKREKWDRRLYRKDLANLKINEFGKRVVKEDYCVKSEKMMGNKMFKLVETILPILGRILLGLFGIFCILAILTPCHIHLGGIDIFTLLLTDFFILVFIGIIAYICWIIDNCYRIKIYG